MPFTLRHRRFLTEPHVEPDELRLLLPADLEAAEYGDYEKPHLQGKNVALNFEKTSTRTRTAFQTAATVRGASVTHLGPSGSQIGHQAVGAAAS